MEMESISGDKNWLKAWLHIYEKIKIVIHLWFIPQASLHLVTYYSLHVSNSLDEFGVQSIKWASVTPQQWNSFQRWSIMIETIFNFMT